MPPSQWVTAARTAGVKNGTARTARRFRFGKMDRKVTSLNENNEEPARSVPAPKFRPH